MSQKTVKYEHWSTNIYSNTANTHNSSNIKSRSKRLSRPRLVKKSYCSTQKHNDISSFCSDETHAQPYNKRQTGNKTNTEENHQKCGNKQQHRANVNSKITLTRTS